MHVSLQVFPPGCLLDNPINAVTTKFVRTSTNKLRCPIFCVAVSTINLGGWIHEMHMYLDESFNSNISCFVIFWNQHNFRNHCNYWCQNFSFFFLVLCTDHNYCWVKQSTSSSESVNHIHLTELSRFLYIHFQAN